jgi:UMF1 family MFS transporter
VQFVGVPFAFLFGSLARRIGTKEAIYVALAVYVVVSVLGYFMRTAAHFYLLAVLVATVQGGSQALGRSLFATLIPRHKSAEFFAFFAIFEKFTGILGPAIFASTVAATGSSRIAILSVIGFFIVGGTLLLFVRIKEGQEAARRAELTLRLSNAGS